MILIADSGSTKTDWIAVDDFGETRRYKTAGINPVFQSTEAILSELKPFFQEHHLPVEEIYFYGAGVINEEKAAVVEKALISLFGDVSCFVASDVLGAARAACGHEAGIACILGTGSNACLYNGTDIIRGVPPMGFILGDEGSGAVLGRQLIGDYFKEIMPVELRKKFHDRFGVEKHTVIERVYRSEKPNKYLAAHSVFLSEEKDHSYCRDLVANQFRAFIERNILQLAEAGNLPVSFVGSVAYFFQDILISELQKKGLALGRVVKEPIEALLRYHRGM